jgi:hypothetical protein
MAALVFNQREIVMRAVRVQYTVQPGFAEENKSNIRKVMNAIRFNPVPGMQYASFVLADGVTFVHINMASDSDTMDKHQRCQGVSRLPSGAKIQRACFSTRRPIAGSRRGRI